MTSRMIRAACREDEDRDDDIEIRAFPLLSVHFDRVQIFLPSYFVSPSLEHDDVKPAVYAPS
jgi:hypothetical protein